MVIRDAPAHIAELIHLGVKFSRRAAGEAFELDLGKEGGHSKRRIVHAEDLTGKAVEEALVASVEADANIKVYDNHMAVDLITRCKVVGPSEKDNFLEASLKALHPSPLISSEYGGIFAFFDAQRKGSEIRFLSKAALFKAVCA